MDHWDWGFDGIHLMHISADPLKPQAEARHSREDANQASVITLLGPIGLTSSGHEVTNYTEN
jgi:hypothetical protein